MKDEKTKALIDQFIRQMAITVRIAIDNGENTKEEALEYIREHGNETFTKTLNMSEDEFMMLALGELVDGLRRLKK